MRVLSIVHQRDAGSGVFAGALAERGDESTEWVPAEQGVPDLDEVDAALVFGGGMHTDQEAELPWLRSEKNLLGALLERGTPALGVCLGAQLLAEVAGGSVGPAPYPEVGWVPVFLTPDGASDLLLGGLPPRFASFQWHSHELRLPPGALTLARSARCLQAFRLQSAPWWGIQFHAEVTAHAVESWIRDYGRDDDAVRAGLDHGALRAETARAIGLFNELGRGICGRFLDRAAAIAALRRRPSVRHRRGT